MRKNQKSKYNLPVVLDSIQNSQSHFKNSVCFFEEYTCESSIHSASNVSIGTIPNSQLSKMKFNLEHIRSIMFKMQKKLDHVENYFEQICKNIEVIKRNSKRITIKIQQTTQQ
ncbi:Hypothetical_protein [Hexamita inflata]|uniref:Hypothetical_protein n=1 Tax=Hexamita inflata TaxID=28002 RepID=A0AA86QH01_9EUKA|nr:Hypothetical protein HINF_LOCUS40599 [Hexamita inflata]